MTLSPENRILVEVIDGWALGEECDLPLDRIEALMNAARAEAATTQAQTLATALADLAVAEDAIVSQTALVMAQGEWMEALEEGLCAFADFADLIDAETSGFMDCDPVALVLVPDEKSPVEMTRVPISAFRRAAALLSPPPQDKEGAGL